MYGDFVWAREALNGLKWRFPARAVAEVETWVDGAYAMAQAAGDRLPATDKAKIVAKLAEFTGVSELFVEQSNLKHRRFPGNCSTAGICAARLREPSWH